MSGRLPDVLIGGAQKSGTTTLHHFLAEHPECYTPPDRQEIHFFDVEAQYARGLDAYRELFAGAGEEKVVFQTSPYYLFLPRAARRIASDCPDMKMIFVLRQPVDRAYSHYWHSVRFGRERLGFEEALAAEAERVERGPLERRVFSYLARGRYAEQIERYFELLGRERVLVLLTDDLRHDLAGTAERLGTFLGLDPAPWHAALARRAEEGGDGAFRRNRHRLPRSRALQRWILPWRWRFPALAWLVEKVNLKTVRYPPMDPATRRTLTQELLPDMKRLSELIDRDLTPWWETAP